MPRVPEFHSVNEFLKEEDERVYHCNDRCGPGREIPEKDQRPGTGNYRLCKKCEILNARGE